MFVFALLVAAACTPTTTVIGGEGKDGSGSGENDTGANDDSGGGDDSADTGADTGGEDSGEDTEPSPAKFAGEYRGVNTGRWQSDRWEAQCEGEVRFDVSEEGALEGLATCAFEDDGEAWALEGELVGKVDEEGALSLVWTLDLGRDEVEVEGAGQIVDGEATVELYADFGREGEYLGEMDARRR